METNKSNLSKAVGKKIKSLRLKRDVSQEVIAKELNISIPALSKIETGITDINLSRLEQIAGIFNCSILSILSDCDADYTDKVETLKDRLKTCHKIIRELQEECLTVYRKQKP